MAELLGRRCAVRRSASSSEVLLLLLAGWRRVVHATRSTVCRRRHVRRRVVVPPARARLRGRAVVLGRAVRRCHVPHRLHRVMRVMLRGGRGCGRVAARPLRRPGPNCLAHRPAIRGHARWPLAARLGRRRVRSASHPHLSSRADRLRPHLRRRRRRRLQRRGLLRRRWRLRRRSLRGAPHVMGRATRGGGGGAAVHAQSWRSGVHRMQPLRQDLDLGLQLLHVALSVVLPARTAPTWLLHGRWQDCRRLLGGRVATGGPNEGAQELVLRKRAQAVIGGRHPTTTTPDAASEGSVDADRQPLTSSLGAPCRVGGRSLSADVLSIILGYKQLSATG